MRKRAAWRTPVLFVEQNSQPPFMRQLDPFWAHFEDATFRKLSIRSIGKRCDLLCGSMARVVGLTVPDLKQ